ncbi:MAG: hypothetical protein HQ591_11535 [candidate division Zixibacteria bacterium]|nr:hypothetical protein [Candidatus Tariuqbacter arcticus]
MSRKPSYGAFNHDQFKRCQRDMKTFRLVNITGEELNDYVSEEEIRLRLELIMGLVPVQGQILGRVFKRKSMRLPGN